MENDTVDILSRRVTSLVEEVDSLRTFVNAVLIAVLLGSAGLGVYILQNYRTLSREVELEKTLANKLADEDRQMAIVATKFKDFAARTPDFAPYLKKYGLTPELAPAATAAPAPAPAKK